MRTDAGGIGLIGFPSREQNLLEVFFSGSEAMGFSLQVPDKAQALLVNMGSAEARRVFERWSRHQASRPGIGVIEADMELDETEMIVLRRPLTLAALKQALRRLQALLPENQHVSTLHRLRSGTPEDAAKPKLAHEEFQALVAQAHLSLARQEALAPVPVRGESARESIISDAQKTPPKTESGDRSRGKSNQLKLSDAQCLELVQHCCGSLPDLDLSLESERRRLMINLTGRFLSFVERSVLEGERTQSVIQVVGVPGELLYFPKADCFSFDLDSALLLQMARARFRIGELSVNERRDLVAPVAPIIARDELLWLLALMTLQGRVPDTVQLEASHQLSVLPDFDRLLGIPNGRRIAQLWVSGRYTVEEVTRMLSVPQRCVLSFLAAGQTAGLFERK